MGRVPGPAVCGRRAGDSCPEWRRRSRSRGRGQRLSEGPRRRPQLPIGEGAGPGLGGPGDRGARGSRSGVGKGVSGRSGPSRSAAAVGVRGRGVYRVLGCSVPAPLSRLRGSPGAQRGRVGSSGVGRCGTEAFGIEPSQPASQGDITDHLPRPSPHPHSPLPLLAAPFVPVERGSAPPLCEGGDSPPVTSLSRFLGDRGRVLPPGERERKAEARGELTASRALPDDHTCHRTHARCHPSAPALPGRPPVRRRRPALHLDAGGRSTRPLPSGHLGLASGPQILLHRTAPHRAAGPCWAEGR